jgi:hypothetical protein
VVLAGVIGSSVVFFSLPLPGLYNSRPRRKRKNMLKGEPNWFRETMLESGRFWGGVMFWFGLVFPQQTG